MYENQAANTELDERTPGRGSGGRRQAASATPCEEYNYALCRGCWHDDRWRPREEARVGSAPHVRVRARLVRRAVQTACAATEGLLSKPCHPPPEKKKGK